MVEEVAWGWGGRGVEEKGEANWEAKRRDEGAREGKRKIKFYSF